MAYRFFSDSVTSNADGVDLVAAGNGDTITFTRGAQYIAAGHLSHVLAIRLGFNVAIDGQLYSGDGPTVYGRFNSNTNDFRVGTTGIVSSAAAAAFQISGNLFTLYSAGEIAGRIGIAATVTTTSIINDGTIFGTANAIQVTSSASTITNHGAIGGHTNGIYVSGGSGVHDIVNSGDVTGHSAGINLTSSGDSHVTNTGTITGRFAVLMSSYTDDDGADRSFTNHGTVTGSAAAFYGSGSIDRVVNDGLLNGDVYLGNADDSYENGGGATTGTAYGGDGADVLIGGAYRDRLDGGTGDDQLFGGAGDDLLTPGTGSDIIDGGEGRDLISFRGTALGVTFHLDGSDTNSTISSVEGIEGGSGDDVLYGDDSINWLYGRNGSDVLHASGGGDYLIGGAGDDYYFSSANGLPADHVIEAANGGNDRLLSSIDVFALPKNVENLTLLSGAVSAHGNELDNSITGNASANPIVGGPGSDTLTGGGGADTFYLTSINSPGIDKIVDFDNDDSIGLYSSQTGLPIGALAASAFYAGTAAHDADDRLIFNPTTHALFYDSDGTGSAVAVQIATILGAAPTASDFFVQ